MTSLSELWYKCVLDCFSLDWSILKSNYQVTNEVINVDLLKFKIVEADKSFSLTVERRNEGGYRFTVRRGGNYSGYDPTRVIVEDDKIKDLLNQVCSALQSYFLNRGIFFFSI